MHIIQRRTRDNGGGGDKNSIHPVHPMCECVGVSVIVREGEQRGRRVLDCMGIAAKRTNEQKAYNDKVLTGYRAVREDDPNAPTTNLTA